MPPAPSDHYTLLGVTRDASQEEIKRAYYEAAQRLHPDKNIAAGETELFLGVQQAYETLSNPKRRAQYDATLPPEQKQPVPFLYKILSSRPNLIHLDEPQILYILLEVETPPAERQAPAPPLNVCLLLDRSTSMQGEKMDVLKAVAIQVLRNLRAQDILSIVSFSDRAEVVIPAGYHTDRSRLESHIQMIQPSGATEIFQGLELGVNEVRRSLDPRRVNHIVLLTDGHTYGDEQACLELANSVALQGIGISAFGVGDEWNDIFLDAISSRTGGSSAYISHPQDIKRLLLEKFNALARIFAEEVMLEYKIAPAAELAYAFRLQPEPTAIPVESPLRMGPLLQDTATQILFEYIIHPEAVKADSLNLFDGILKVSIPSRPTPVPPLQMRFQRVVSNSPETDPPPPQIVYALSRLMLYRMQERARKEAESGNIDNAARHLKAMASKLLGQGERSLARTILLEVDNLEAQKSLSQEGSKKIKYGTRALFSVPRKEYVP